MAKFLVTVLCSPGWRLPDDYVPSQIDRPIPDPKLDTTHLIGYMLTKAVANAISEFDRTTVAAEDITVNFGELHGAAFHAPDIWIVFDDVGGQRYPHGVAAHRREQITAVIEQALADALASLSQDIYPRIFIGDRTT